MHARKAQFAGGGEAEEGTVVGEKAIGLGGELGGRRRLGVGEGGIEVAGGAHLDKVDGAGGGVAADGDAAGAGGLELQEGGRSAGTALAPAGSGGATGAT